MDTSAPETLTHLHRYNNYSLTSTIPTIHSIKFICISNIPGTVLKKKNLLAFIVAINSFAYLPDTGIWEISIWQRRRPDRQANYHT